MGRKGWRRGLCMGTVGWGSGHSPVGPHRAAGRCQAGLGSHRRLGWGWIHVQAPMVVGSIQPLWTVPPGPWPPIVCRPEVTPSPCHMAFCLGQPTHGPFQASEEKVPTLLSHIITAGAPHHLCCILPVKSQSGACPHARGDHSGMSGSRRYLGSLDTSATKPAAV